MPCTDGLASGSKNEGSAWDVGGEMVHRCEGVACLPGELLTKDADGVCAILQATRDALLGRQLADFDLAAEAGVLRRRE